MAIICADICAEFLSACFAALAEFLIGGSSGSSGGVVGASRRIESSAGSIDSSGSGVDGIRSIADGTWARGSIRYGAQGVVEWGEMPL